MNWIMCKKWMPNSFSVLYLLYFCLSSQEIQLKHKRWHNTHTLEHFIRKCEIVQIMNFSCIFTFKMIEQDVCQIFNDTAYFSFKKLFGFAVIFLSRQFEYALKRKEINQLFCTAFMSKTTQTSCSKVLKLCYYAFIIMFTLLKLKWHLLIYHQNGIRLLSRWDFQMISFYKR